MKSTSSAFSFLCFFLFYSLLLYLNPTISLSTCSSRGTRKSLRGDLVWAAKLDGHGLWKNLAEDDLKEQELTDKDQLAETGALGLWPPCGLEVQPGLLFLLSCLLTLYFFYIYEPPPLPFFLFLFFLWRIISPYLITSQAYSWLDIILFFFPFFFFFFFYLFLKSLLMYNSFRRQYSEPRSYKRDSNKHYDVHYFKCDSTSLFMGWYIIFFSSSQ